MEVLVRCAAIVGALAISSSASAHIELLSHPSRETNQKQGPCGVTGSVRGSNVTVAQSGSTLHVEWHESVDHPSHFRISFDADGDDAFADPASYDDRFTNDAVLIDGISDKAGGVFAADVVLPDIACDHCTLQLIQVMYDKGPYAVGTNDNYYRCIDLTLTKEPVETSTEGATPAPDPSVDGGTTGPASPSDPAPTGDYGAGTPQDQNAGSQMAPTSQPSGSSEQYEDSGETSYGCDVAPGTPAMHAGWLLSLFLINVFALRYRIRREREALAVPANPMLASQRDAKGTRTNG